MAGSDEACGTETRCSVFDPPGGAKPRRSATTCEIKPFEAEECTHDARDRTACEFVRNTGSTPQDRRHYRAHTVGASGLGNRLSRHPPEARELAADQFLQASRRGQCGGHAG